MNKRFLRVLLVEDDEDDFLLARDLLGDISTFDCQTQWAATYAAAKAALRENTFDVCLIDYRLGERTGLELVREAIAEGCRTPIILLTGEDDHALDLEAMKAGAADYLLKAKMETATLERSIRYALERKRAEEAVQNSRDHLDRIINAVADPIIVINRQHQLTLVNNAMCRVMGHSREDSIGKSLHELFPARVADVFREKDELIFTSGKEIVSEEQFTDPLGNTRVIITSKRPYVDKDGEQFIVSIVNDITERKQAEEALLKNEAKFRDLFDNAPVAYHELDLEGCFTRINHTEELLLGYTDAELKGRHCAEIIVEKISREATAAKLAGKMPLQTSEQTFIRKDGTLVPMLIEDRLIYDADGKVTGIRSTLQDITELKRADAALRESEYKLRTLLESMREGLMQVDNRECVVFVNDRFCEMVGFSSDELMKTNWARLVFEDDGDYFVKQVSKRRREGISDSYEISLRKKSGEKLWVIVGGAPTLDADGFVTGSMGVFTDITERKRAEERMLHDAFHDGLTGLANRTLFTDHLQMTIERAKRDRQDMFAVLFLDFDRFKVINDSLGHAEGDNLLKQIARRLESSLRSGDLVARLGGDEFTILINKLNDSSVALRVAERIQSNLQIPFEIGGGEIFISASIGIALSTTGHEKAEDMLRDADIAMYRAKAKGKAQHQVFDRAMHEHALKQLRLETEMRQALERGEFELHYQPIMNLETESLTGFESLVRWIHPEHGVILPFEFVPAAEENGLILLLGQWILQESCRQLRQWQNNPAASNLTVSVNLSAKQFLQADLSKQIAATLEKTGLDPRCLKLEITESHIMKNTETAIRTMSNLRALGIELSLDDFGTGYSSLSYLHRLPVNYLKIDRSFVSRMIESEENSEIVHTIIKLGQNLKMKVVAEGIETAEQLAQLKILNCEYGQGYFFSKPLEAAAAEAFINENLEISAHFTN